MRVIAEFLDVVRSRCCGAGQSPRRRREGGEESGPALADGPADEVPLKGIQHRMDRFVAHRETGGRSAECLARQELGVAHPSASVGSVRAAYSRARAVAYRLSRSLAASLSV